ncbi:MAG: cyclic nucleotide-binding domain-containing protein, partial [Candidatus Heimdallarchaeota archaeon]|nr:cyclic nucleotide-binding domain-containing protein [Candidatus Heimdallarchaeota archaeon]
MPKEFLRQVELFENLSEADLDKLCELANEIHLKDGDYLFREGEPGNDAYIIKSGKLDVLKQSGDRTVL